MRTIKLNSRKVNSRKVRSRKVMSRKVMSRKVRSRKVKFTMDASDDDSSDDDDDEPVGPEELAYIATEPTHVSYHGFTEHLKRYANAKSNLDEALLRLKQARADVARAKTEIRRLLAIRSL